MGRIEKDTKGLVLVSVMIERKKTTISLDDKLFGYLAARMGGSDRAILWLRAEAQWQDRASAEAGVKSGLSRLVQRRALDVLLGGEPFGHGFDGAAEVAGPGEPSGAGGGEGAAPAESEKAA